MAPRLASGVWFNHPAPKALRNDFDFFYRWAYDNVIEMLCVAETDLEWETACNLYRLLMQQPSRLSKYQLAPVLPEGPFESYEEE